MSWSRRVKTYFNFTSGNRHCSVIIVHVVEEGKECDQRGLEVKSDIIARDIARDRSNESMVLINRLSLCECD